VELNLNQIIRYLEEKENCKVISDDNSLSIIDLEKQELCLHNKDYRLLNELARDHVKDNYPLFHKEFNNDLDEVIIRVFRIPIDKKKFKGVTPFKKITKKKVIGFVGGKPVTKTIIRRKIS
jgi:hypothetical protein